MTRRHDLVALLLAGPRTASSLARELGLHRRDMDEELGHILRTASAAGHTILVEPARCKDCGFRFSTAKLTKPSRCPSCKGSRIFEPLLQLE